MEGDGLIDDAYNFTKKVIYGRQTLPPKVEELLKRIGNERVLRIRIGRSPLPAVLTGIAKVISSSPPDKLFHLFMIFQTERINVLLEKNEVINMQINPIPPKNCEYITITNVPHYTINEYLQNTENRMGKDKFIKYSAYDNNCSVFIENVLLANGIHEGIDFVKQKTEEIFRNHPTLRKIANTITDIAGRADVVLHGGAEKCSTCSNGMTGNKIISILKTAGCYNFHGVYSKDKIPHLKKSGWYVLNMENENDGDGTHWIAWKYDPVKCSYMDAFGIIPPIDVLENSRSIVYTSKQIQNEKSTCCGWYCIACILLDEPRISPEANLKRFESRFSSNTIVNDSILNDILTKKGVKAHLHL